MYPIINVIMLCHFSGQLDPDPFQSLGLSGGSGKGSVFHPILPAIGLHMSLIGNLSGIILSRQRNFNAFQTLCQSGCTGQVSVKFISLPAISLHMSLVSHTRMLINIGGIARRGSAFFYQTHLNGFQTFGVPFRSGDLSVFRPVKPAISLRVHPIVNIVMLRQFPSQFDPDRFQAFRLSGCSAFGSVFHPVKPAVSLHLRTILNLS